MKKRLWIMLVTIVVIVAIVAVILYICVCNNYICKIIYKDGSIPGETYEFYITKDYNVRVIRKTYCSTLECIESGNTVEREKYTVKISNKNKEIFKVFIMKLFPIGENEIELSPLTMDDNSEQIMRVLKYNDESFFEYYRTIY